ncbi:MAG: DUF3795 domain-containing protein [Treponema sp.]|jgi:hypothetical protein|nr:DUF3795 domain-containing protein [Treponema sp.]
MENMDKKYTCYCGLYCENCAVKKKIGPASEVLYNEMKKAGFEDIIKFIPDSGGFWPFLKNMAENGICISCREGGGNPACAVRICASGRSGAKEENAGMCAFCEDYPCEKFKPFFEGYPVLKNDNDVLRNEGWDAWSKMQNERMAKGFTY